MDFEREKIDFKWNFISLVNSVLFLINMKLLIYQQKPFEFQLKENIKSHCFKKNIVNLKDLIIFYYRIGHNKDKIINMERDLINNENNIKNLNSRINILNNNNNNQLIQENNELNFDKRNKEFQIIQLNGKIDSKNKQINLLESNNQNILEFVDGLKSKLGQNENKIINFEREIENKDNNIKNLISEINMLKNNNFQLTQEKINLNNEKKIKKLK